MEKDELVNIKIKKSLRKKLKAEANEKDITLQEFLEEIIEYYLTNKRT